MSLKRLLILLDVNAAGRGVQLDERAAVAELARDVMLRLVDGAGKREVGADARGRIAGAQHRVGSARKAQCNAAVRSVYFDRVF